MEPTGQNSVHTAVFNLSYSSKDVAVRGNQLIEAIFNSQILPELDKVISNAIPKDAVLVLAKLEIDIGRIDESELSDHLAYRIGKALNKTLYIIDNKTKKSMEREQDGLANNRENQESGDMEIRVSNAGIVLFWPFLSRFFEKLNLTENDAFINEQSRNEARYLLQYLTYNRIDFSEHQLVINKILVGMLPSEILLPISPLSEEAKNMAESLINGLKSNWDKVKDSSPEAIQETFLQRDGILIIKEDKMVLTVDKKGVDVLLNSIPWNITLIKLPWMQKPLYAEWV